MKGLKALPLIMEVQWIYNPIQVNQSPPACWGMKERERGSKRKEQSRELVGIKPCSVRLPVYTEE